MPSTRRRSIPQKASLKNVEMAKRRSERHEFHIACLVCDDGSVSLSVRNDTECCAERRLLRLMGGDHAHGSIVVVRLRVTPTKLTIKASRPCDACRLALNACGDRIHSVVWSVDADNFESCRPCDVPPNTYSARSSVVPFMSDVMECL